MDSLETYLTNVIAIDKFSQVTYRIYVQSPTPNTDTLRQADRCLLDDGKISLLDRTKEELWVFEQEQSVLNEDGSSLRTTHESYGEKSTSNYNWADISHRLTVKGKGTLNFTNPTNNSAILTSTNISNTSATPTIAPNITATTLTTQHPTPSSVLSDTQRDARLLQQLSQQQRNSSNMSISGVGSPVNGSRDNLASDSLVSVIDGFANGDAGMIRVRAKFVQALIRTLSFNLTKKKGWLPFSFSSLIYQDRGPSTTNDVFNYSSVEPLPFSIVDLVAQHTPQGTINIIPRITIQPTITNLNLNQDLNNGDSVWLAPGGTLAVFSNANDHDVSEAKSAWKTIVRKWLDEKGIIIDKNARWAKVSIWTDIEEHMEAWWPYECVFFRLRELSCSSYSSPFPTQLVSRGNNEIFDIHHNPYLRPSETPRQSLDEKDPGLTWLSIEDSMSFAEEWLMGKSEREKEMEKLRDVIVHSPDPTSSVKSELGTKSGDGSLLVVDPGSGDAVIGNGNLATPSGLSSVATPNLSTKGVEPTSSINGPPTAPATAEATESNNSGDVDMDNDTWVKPVEAKLDAETNHDGDIFGGMSLGNDADDLNDDLFGGEVTEADFGFFDDVPLDSFDMMRNDDDELMTGANPEQASNVQIPASAAYQSISNLDLTFDGMGLSGFSDDKLMEEDMDLDLEDITAEMDMHGAVPTQGIKDGKEGQLLVQTSAFPSSDADAGQQLVLKDKPEIKVQIHTPPLSPHRAMKLLLIGTPSTKVQETPARQPPIRRLSLYSPVKFPSFVQNSDKKYMEGGRFFCLPEDKEAEQNNLDTRVIKRSRSQQLKPSREIIFLDDEEDLCSISSMDSDDSTTSSDADELSGEEDDDLHFEDGLDEKSLDPRNPQSPTFTRGRKRKRRSNDWGNGSEDFMNTDSPLSPLKNRSPEQDSLDVEDVQAIYAQLPQLPPPPWQILESDPSDPLISDIFRFTDSQRNASKLPPSDELDAIFNIFLEQVVWSSCVAPHCREVKQSSSAAYLVETDASQNIRNLPVNWNFKRREQILKYDIRDTIINLLSSQISYCTLEVYTKTSNSINSSSPSMMRGLHNPGRRGSIKDSHLFPTRTSNNDSSGSSPTPSAIFKLPPVHVHVHRNIASGDAVLEITSSALPFWETFALVPHSGSKNIISIFVYPGNGALQSASDIFLDRLGAVYEGCRFGGFSRAECKDVNDGLLNIQIPNDVDGVNLDDILMCYNKAFVSLGETLAELSDELQNVVIFVVNPFSSASTMVDLCAAFCNLQKAYIRSVQGQKQCKPNNIVLQILPIDMVAVKDGVIAQSQSQFCRFAIEVYNRCTPTDSSNFGSMFPQELHSPSLLLAKPPPKSIDFKFNPEPSPAILQENKCLHVAYSQSIDERWICVSWSDNWGDIKSVKSYCLGARGTATLRVFEEVCEDIWNDTLAIITKKKIHWRIILVKAGPVEADELDIWTKLSADSIISNTLTILSVDLTPPLTISASLPPLLPMAFNPQGQNYATPMPSTPQTSTLSPDQVGTGPGTPGTEAYPDLDVDSTLIDYTDEVWGIVLSHSLPNTNSLIMTVPALISGYLVKRSGLNDYDNLAVMSVSLIHLGTNNNVMAGNKNTTASSKACESTLREILEYYRGLVTLGQHFGVIDPVKQVVPWHVAAAVKAQEAFAACL